MKKILIILCLLILVSGCKKKEEVKVTKVSSTGTLTCTYKAYHINEDTTYTSQYIFNYTVNGILDSVQNNEIITFGEQTSDEIKKEYETSTSSIKDEYKDIDGVTAKLEEKENKKQLIIDMKLEDMEEKQISEYQLNYDRKRMSKLYTIKGYTCK